MLHGHRSLLLGVLPLLVLCGCQVSSNSVGSNVSNAGSTNNDSGNSGPVNPTFGSSSTLEGSSDTVVATASMASVAVVVGSNRTLSITFTSDDGRAISGFGVSATLATLPAGWTGPASFSCASVTTGSSCVLNLTYAPTAIDSGALSINYVFVDNATVPKTGAVLIIPYVATAHDNVAAAASPTGQITAPTTGSQAVSVNFTTDDGNAATQLTVTSDLAALPPGWTSATPSLACAIVSTGNGCQLNLVFAPTTAVGGTLALNYSFRDDTGAAKTGTVNIPYSTTSTNDVVATAAPAAQVIAVQKTGGQPVSITFTTDDGKPASAVFVTSNLKALPSGWSSASDSFACSSVGTGSGCQLHLTYAPTALTSGTLTLAYAYEDGSGTPRTALLNLGYAATTNDNIVGTASPSGQINAVVSDGSQMGNGSQAVSVTFTTDDGRPATALRLTTDLTMLPAGWTSTQSTLLCDGLNADNSCQLTLAYAPTAAGNGTLILNYAYENNANEAKTGTVNIAYRATSNDNVRGIPSQSTLPVVRTGSASTAVTVTFTTDDGNPASQVTVTSGLTALPAGWTAASNTFACATVSAGTDCTLSLLYTPTVAATNGTVILGFSYQNDAGYPGTGTVAISYGAYTPYLYIADAGTNDVSSCALNFDNSLGACAISASGFASPTGIALSGVFAYVTNTTGDSVSRCTLDGGGLLTGCVTTGPLFSAPTAISVNAANTLAYVEQSTGLTVCAIASGTGALSSCVLAAPLFDPLNGIALSADGLHAYGVHPSPNGVDVCGVAMNGMLAACNSTVAGSASTIASLAIRNSQLYVTSTNGLYACALDTTGNITSCQTTAAGTAAYGLAFSGTAAAGATAYVSTGSAVLACPVHADGTFGNCATTRDPTFNGAAGLAVH